MLEELDAGRSYADVLRDLHRAGRKITQRTLEKYRAQARAADRKENPPDPDAAAPALALLRERRADREAAPEDPSADIDITGQSALDITRDLVQQLKRRVKYYQDSRQDQLAERATARLVDAANSLSRLEREASSGGDGIVIGQAELAPLELSLRERVRAATERPLLCAHCSRALSIDWGGYEITITPKVAE